MSTQLWLKIVEHSGAKLSFIRLLCAAFPELIPMIRKNLYHLHVDIETKTKMDFRSLRLDYPNGIILGDKVESITSNAWNTWTSFRLPPNLISIRAPRLSLRTGKLPTSLREIKLRSLLHHGYSLPDELKIFCVDSYNKSAIAGGLLATRISVGVMKSEVLASLPSSLTSLDITSNINLGDEQLHLLPSRLLSLTLMGPNENKRINSSLLPRSLTSLTTNYHLDLTGAPRLTKLDCRADGNFPESVLHLKSSSFSVRDLPPNVTNLSINGISCCVPESVIKLSVPTWDWSKPIPSKMVELILLCADVPPEIRLPRTLRYLTVSSLHDRTLLELNNLVRLKCLRIHELTRFPQTISRLTIGNTIPVPTNVVVKVR